MNSGAGETSDVPRQNIQRCDEPPSVEGEVVLPAERQERSERVYPCLAAPKRRKPNLTRER